MAYSACDDLDQNLAGRWVLERDIFDGNWCVLLLEDSGFVGLWERRHAGNCCLRFVLDGGWKIETGIHKAGERCV